MYDIPWTYCILEVDPVAYNILSDEVKKNHACLSLFYHVCCLILLLFFRLLRQGVTREVKGAGSSASGFYSWSSDTRF